MSSRFTTEMHYGTIHGLSIPSLYLTHTGHPIVVGRLGTGDGHGHHYERNGKFCITTGPVKAKIHYISFSVASPKHVTRAT